MPGGRPRSFPKLKELRADVVAEDAVRLLVDRVRTAAEWLTPAVAVAVAIGPDTPGCALGARVKALVHIGQGALLLEPVGVSHVLEDLENVGSLLGFDASRLPERPQVEPFLSVPSLLTVVHAVRGRIAITQKSSLTIVEFAVLQGIDASVVRQRARRGEDGFYRRGDGAWGVLPQKV